jgi:hypothetical protein
VGVSNDSKVTRTIHSKTELSRMARKIRSFVRILAAMLALIFGWLKLQGVPLPRLESDGVALLLLRLALVIYYFAWLSGVLFDTRVEEEVLYAAPQKGKIPPIAYGICVLVVVVFGVLCWVKNYPQFIVVLTFFWVVDILGWRYYLVARLIQPAMQESLETYKAEGAYFLVEQARQLEAYIAGSWKWARFWAGLGFIGVLAVLAFTRGAEIVAQRAGFLSASALLSLGILLWVLSMEGWIWYHRLRSTFVIRYLEEMKTRYRLAEPAARSSEA